MVCVLRHGCYVVEDLNPNDQSGGKYDVILMDYQMPNMDGPTAISAIRALGYTGVILGLTGNAAAIDQEAMVTAGADGVLTKPLDANLFWNTLKTMMS